MVNDYIKFRVVFFERFKGKGRFLKYYYLLLKKEKIIFFVVYRILLKSIVDIVCYGGLRLVYFYGFLKMYKILFVMCLILFVSVIYNYELVKWLESKLKLFFYNEFIVYDILDFVEEIIKVKIK